MPRIPTSCWVEVLGLFLFVRLMALASRWLLVCIDKLELASFPELKHGNRAYMAVGFAYLSCINAPKSPFQAPALLMMRSRAFLYGLALQAGASVIWPVCVEGVAPIPGESLTRP